MTNQIDPGASKAPRTSPNPIWVTPKEAIRLISIGRTRLYELINDGTIKSKKIGRKRFIAYASLEALGEPARD